jgi:histidyl-tRNA synthetase
MTEKVTQKMSESSVAKQASKAERLFAVKGMNDILPPESAQWEWFESHVREVMIGSAYRNIRTPIVEPTSLFVRGTGETTDIVEKEMYSFEDRLNGEQLTLRPENTPGVVRAAIEHNLTYDGGKRLYYMGPMFRHERPQRGRYRQFYQLGAEVLGFAGPEIDAELILMAHQLFGRLGLRNIQIQINSLGVPAERQTHRDALIAHFKQHEHLLDADAQRRLYANPLRILDTKNPAMQELVQAAPQLLGFLGEASLKHLDTVKRILTACGLVWTINPRLVRGLDYYSHTVFEFITTELGAQGTLCGGGRYDGLFEVLGGKSTPAVGWGMGVERVLELLKVQSLSATQNNLDAYAISLDMADAPLVANVLHVLRGKGIRIQMHATIDGSAGAMKSQFKKADASGARYALVFGPDELAKKQVIIKSLRDGQGVQALYSLESIDNWAHLLRV